MPDLKYFNNNNLIFHTQDDNDTDEVILSVDEIENFLRKSKGKKKSKKPIVQRVIDIPIGEPIKLQFQLDDISKLSNDKIIKQIFIFKYQMLLGQKRTSVVL